MTAALQESALTFVVAAASLDAAALGGVVASHLVVAGLCAEEEELLRLRLRELDIVEGWLVFGFLVGDVECDVVCSVS
jgi:hypothetical protein